MSIGERDELLRYEENIRIEEILMQYDGFIIAVVREHIGLDPTLIRAAVRDLEIDELVQLVRIKLWHALERKEILYPKAYIRRIVYSEIVDMTRRQKRPVQPLPEDEEGEIYSGKLLVSPGEGMADPAEVVEQWEEVRGRMKEVVGVVLQLPARQRHAMICTLRDRVDDPQLLVDAFKQNKCEMQQWQWPQMRKEKILLQASLSYARHTVLCAVFSEQAHQMQYLLTQRRKRRKQMVATATEGCQN
jgi:DNA-directed RNA polymerase specialized sigma24 family protein